MTNHRDANVSPLPPTSEPAQFAQHGVQQGTSLPLYVAEIGNQRGGCYPNESEQSADDCRGLWCAHAAPPSILVQLPPPACPPTRSSEPGAGHVELPNLRAVPGVPYKARLS